MKFPNKLYLLALVALVVSSFAFAGQGGRLTQREVLNVNVSRIIEELDLEMHEVGFTTVRGGYVFTLQPEQDWFLRRATATEIEGAQSSNA